MSLILPDYPSFDTLVVDPLLQLASAHAQDVGLVRHRSPSGWDSTCSHGHAGSDGHYYLVDITFDGSIPTGLLMKALGQSWYKASDGKVCPIEAHPFAAGSCPGIRLQWHPIYTPCLGRPRGVLDPVGVSSKSRASGILLGKFLPKRRYVPADKVYLYLDRQSELRLGMHA